MALEREQIEEPAIISSASKNKQKSDSKYFVYYTIHPSVNMQVSLNFSVGGTISILRTFLVRPV